MTITTGAELLRFYNDDAYWPKDDATGEHTYYDYLSLEVNGDEWEEGVEDIPAEAKVKIHSGVIFFEPGSSGKSPKEWGFAARFRKWRKSQSVELLAFEVPKAQVDAAVAAMSSLGAKRIK